VKKSIKIALCAAAAAKLAYLLFSPRVATRLYHSKLFSKDSDEGSEDLLANFREYENRQVLFAGGGGKQLRGWFFQHPTSNLVYLYCMGRASDIPKNLEHIRMLLETGASVFIFEYHGFGKSQGRPTLVSVVEDAFKAISLLINKLGYAPQQIITYGESLGGGIATQLLTRYRVLGHVVQSSYTSLEDIAKEMLPLLKVYPQALFPNPRLDTVATLGSNKTPVCIITGVHDEVIPAHHSHTIYEAAAGAKRLVLLQNSGHREIEKTDREAFIRELSQFLRSL
jgi:alpha-beta hydrolase superfamily lysophospholipase